MISPSATESCVLVAEVTGDASLVGKLGAVEAARAVERCLSRAGRCVEANQGQMISEGGRRMVAWFTRSDNAVLAASEMRERVASLPPVSGVSLGVRIAVHSGHLDDATGQPDQDSIAQATTLVSLASPRQVLLSGEAVNQMSEALRSQLDSQTQLSIPTEGFELPPFELKSGALNLRDSTYRTPFNVAAPGVSDAGPRSEPPPSTPRPRMMLRYLGQSYLVSDLHPVLLVGREDGNDVVISDRRASRHHARIEWREGRYVLIDNSTNGTYLVDDSGVEIVLRRGECDMPARGRIGLGFSPNETDTDSMMFDIGQR